MTVRFPAPLPLDFGGFQPLPSYPSIPGTSLAWIESHCDEGLALLLSQFRGKPRIEALLCKLLDGVQDVEDVGWQLLTERWLATAIGAQLDRLGKIVDLARHGWDDETYRALLRAQILVLRSEGTWPSVSAVLIAIGLDASEIDVGEVYPAAITIDLGQVAPIDERQIFDFIERARSGAIRLSLIAPTVPIAESFTFADLATVEVDADRGLGDGAGANVGGYLADGMASSTEDA